MATNGDLKAPAEATEAVLRVSDPVDEGAKEVKGIDFDKYKNHAITVPEMIEGMVGMGFQATAIGEAVRVINGMVRMHRMRIWRPRC